MLEYVEFDERLFDLECIVERVPIHLAIHIGHMFARCGGFGV